MIDKTYSENWLYGDTFAVKIESDDKEYNGRYFILIKGYNKNWYDCPNKPTLRAKITKDKNLPKTEQEIDELEYVKTLFCHFKSREEIRYLEGFYTLTKEQFEKEYKASDYYPDEYNYLYYYHFEMTTSAKKLDNFIYLGNFQNIKLPKEENPINQGEVRAMMCTSDDVAERLLSQYKQLNLKQSDIYTKEGQEYVLKNAEEALKKFEGISKKYHLPTKEEYMKQKENNK